MICSRCERENAPDARFCSQCGAALGPICANCSHTNPPASRFCNQCGQPLAATAGVNPPIPSPCSPDNREQLPARPKSSPRCEAPSGRQGLTPLVGRDAELRKLHAAWQEARRGRGRFVSVVGEAGLGKSRLLYEFKRSLAKERGIHLEASCFAYGDSISYLPFVRIVKDFVQLEETSPEQESNDRIAKCVAGLGVEPAKVVPYLQNLLAFTVEDDVFPRLLPHLVRERTVEALKTLILAMANVLPLALIIEDAQWIDKASEEAVGALVETLASVPLLLVLVHRPEYLHPWTESPSHSQIALAHLPGVSSADMVRAILAKPRASETASDTQTAAVPHDLRDAGNPAELERLVADRTRGNPFFVEELTLSLIESGDLIRAGAGYALRRSSDTVRLPTTVQAVLLSRLDRLNAELKQLVQVASVIGRVFSYPLLARVADSPAALDQALAQLEDFEFIYPTSLVPHREYSFKHVLTQEAVYDSLPERTRQSLHDRIGQAMEALHPRRLEECCELLAHHYSRSGNSAKAVEYLDLANQKSAAAYAMTEARVYFDEAIKLLDTIPATLANRRRRISLVVNQLLVFWLLYQHPEYYELLSHYEETALELGDDSLLGAFYTRLAHCHWVFGRLEQALATATKAARYCEAGGNLEDLSFAYMILQWTHMHLGNYEQSLEWQQRTLQALKRSFNLRWYSWSLAAGSYTYHYLGRWDDAIGEATKELAIAEQYSDRSLTGFAHWILAQAYTAKGDLGSALSHGETAVSLAPTPGDRAWAQSILGWACCRAGQATEASQMLAELIPMYQATRFLVGEVYTSAFLGEAYWRAGELENARVVLERVVELTNQVGMRFFRGCAHRLLGELSLARSDDLAAAAGHFDKAIGVLQEIHAENELALAYAGLGRYYGRRKDTAMARRYLSEALEIFECLGTWNQPDEAKQLLEALTEA